MFAISSVSINSGNSSMMGSANVRRTFFPFFSAIFAILFQSDYNSFAKLLLFCEIGTVVGYKFDLYG
jgi:hypothetical protein